MNKLISQLEQIFPKNKIDIFGKGIIIKSSIPYYLVTVLVGINLLQKKPNPFAFIAVAYALFPTLDEIFSLDNRNPNEEERKSL